MDVTVIFGVALGLAASYWIVATGCSFFLEACCSIANIRGKALTQFIAEMLGARTGRPWTSVLSTFDVKVWWSELRMPKQRRDRMHALMSRPESAAAQLAMRVLTHPLIAALDKPSIRRGGASVDASYIPAEQFARALLDVVVNTPTVAKLREALQQANIPTTLQVSLISAVEASTASHDLLERLQRAAATWVKDNANQPDQFNGFALDVRESFTSHGISSSRASALASLLLATILQRVERVTFSDLKAALANDLLPRSLRDSLEPLVSNVAHDIDEARLTVERWYDSAMERATGWYKRYTMIWLFMLGLAVSIALGFDSIEVGRQLVRNAEFRASAERLARRINEQPEETRAWVQRSLVSRALPSDGYLTADPKKRLTDEPAAQELQAFKLRGELQLLVTGLGDAKLAGAGVLMISENFANDAELTIAKERVSNWQTISKAIDEARGCNDKQIVKEDLSPRCGQLQVQLAIANLSEPGARGAPRPASTQAPSAGSGTGNSSGPLGNVAPSDASRTQASASESGAPTSQDMAIAPTDREVATAAANAGSAQATPGEDGCKLSLQQQVLTRAAVRTLTCLYLTDANLIAARNKTVAMRIEVLLAKRSIPAGDKQALDEANKALDELRGSVRDAEDPLASFILTKFELPQCGSPGCYARRGAGFLITALMIALGAPFWFELIGKVVNMRGTGGKP
jgi:hypothetical protein